MTDVHRRNHTPEELARLWPDLPLEAGLARRIVSRTVWEDRDDLAGVRGLSAARRREIEERTRADRLEVAARVASAIDPFVKYLFRAPDGIVFESVRIPLHRPRWSVCVSSQAGCGLGCAFCETGRIGLRRNLETWEMVEQVLSVRRDGPERPVTGVVFQGQGEPLQNYDAVLRAAALARHPAGLRIRAENITISTVGLLPAIERYVDEGHPYRLILSLTSAFGAKRASLVPAGRTWDVPQLAAAVRRLAERRGGPVHLGWVLISGFNTGDEEAEELARLFRGIPVRLSVIDVNDPSGRFRRADDAERRRFLDALGSRGIGFARRYSGGSDVHAACGMLANRAAPAPSAGSPPGPSA